MRLATFYSLRDWLLEYTNLRGDNITQNRRIRELGKQVLIEQKLIIFIYIISRVASYRDTTERFSRSSNTISIIYIVIIILINSRLFHEVLDALLILYPLFVTLPIIDTPLSSRIADNLKYTPYFDDCLRALDGTYIAVYISTS
jgi:hypothetical protein